MERETPIERQERYECWVDTYYRYLMEMKRLVETNFYKELKGAKLDSDTFFKFVYSRSSQYISPYEHI